jgi:hypothetical protein
MNDDEGGAPGSGEERAIATPYAPEVIGSVAGRNDVPQIALAERWPEVIDPPPPTGETRAELHGMVYVPAGVPEGVSVAGQCSHCLGWYFWPVRSADGVALLQCASCYSIYRPLGD